MDQSLFTSHVGMNSEGRTNLELVRFESLLDQGWKLMDLLNRWRMAWPHQSSESDELIEILTGLQIVWVKSDDLALKRIARTSLVLEQFFERLCAKNVPIPVDPFNSLNAVIAGLKDLLLGIEATGEEPGVYDLESLKRVEEFTRQQSSSDRPSRTIEVGPAVDVVSQPPGSLQTLVLTRTPQKDDLPAVLQQSVAEEVPALRDDRTASHLRRIEQTQVPRVSKFIVTRNDLSVVPEVPPKSGENHSVTEPETLIPEPAADLVWVLDESLFYRHLIEIALRSAGYPVEVMAPSDVEAFRRSGRTLSPCRAVLVDSSLSVRLSGEITQVREAGGTKIIGLKAGNTDEPFMVELDAAVPKSRPQQLISVLDQLLNPDSDQPRKIA
jgi:hypothetical protein